MFQLDPLGLVGLIPKGFKQKILDTLVDFVADQAKKYASDEIAAKVKRLRSDAAFNQAFEEGLQRAAKRFSEEYEVEDEDLVAAIAADKDFFTYFLGWMTAQRWSNSDQAQEIIKGNNLRGSIKGGVVYVKILIILAKPKQ
jgi:hypothetical protein